MGDFYIYGRKSHIPKLDSRTLATSRNFSRRSATHQGNFLPPTGHPIPPYSGNWTFATHRNSPQPLSTIRNPSGPLSTDRNLNCPSQNRILATRRNFSKPYGGTFTDDREVIPHSPGIRLPQLPANPRNPPQPTETLRNPIRNPSVPLFTDWGLNCPSQNRILANPINPSAPLATDWNLNYPVRNSTPQQPETDRNHPQPTGGTFYRRQGGNSIFRELDFRSPPEPPRNTPRNPPKPSTTHRGQFLPTGT